MRTSVAIIGFLLLCTAMVARSTALFVTDEGTGPDKWASVWLLTRFVDASTVVVRDEESGLADAEGDTEIVFDVVGSTLGRTGSRTSYTAIAETYGIDSEAVTVVGDIVHDIEIDAWALGASAEAQIVESAFRRMQLAFGRDDVAPLCYLRFFDAVAEHGVAGTLALDGGADLVPENGCMGEAAPTSVRSVRVPSVDLGTVVTHRTLGADVTFVDTREAWEYEEGHIPGAINMPLRDISADTVAELLDDDLVIAYCVKDFRGYEAAKRLRSLGVEAAIMKPYGMRGWIEAGLPVAGSRGLPADEAEAAMRALARAAVESP